MRVLVKHFVVACFLVVSGCCFPGEEEDSNEVSNPSRLGPYPLSRVRTWGSQIQGLDDDGAVDALVRSKYDLLVLEPTRTGFLSEGSRDFDTKGMVARLKASAARDGQHRKLILTTARSLSGRRQAGVHH
jgi:hypothetical protein